MHVAILHLRSHRNPLQALRDQLEAIDVPRDLVVVLPEVIDIECGYYEQPWAEASPERTDDYLRCLQQICDCRRLSILAGLRKCRREGRPHNAAFLLVPDGKPTCMHVKVNVDLEPQSEPGSGLLPGNPATLPCGDRLGSLICLDCSRSELIQDLRDRETTIVGIPAASGSMNLECVREDLRGMVVVMANSHGESFVSDSHGRVLLQEGVTTRPGDGEDRLRICEI